jgi:hypothetical protein
VTSVSAPGERGLLASALAHVGGWFVEPLETRDRPARIQVRSVVAVVGLSAGCGTTTVARALAVELARRDASAAAAVAGDAGTGALAPGGAAAGRLARAIGSAAGRIRTAGRLCLIAGAELPVLGEEVRTLAPLVLDLGQGEPAGIGAALADHVVLVSPPAAEPALAAVVAASLARIGPAPLIVVNRLTEPAGEEADRWAGRAAVALPDSRGGARLALAGRDARGGLGSGVRALADSCEGTGGAW